jgi:diguanylate cyclase (GGDEF)-like protein
LKILVVDDDPLFRETVRGNLESLGHSVALAEDGREGHRLLLAESYPVVITDWEMPGMNGLELCREIRDAGLPRYTYVILVTVHRGQQNVLEALSAGADDFMVKPFHREELEIRLHAAERILNLETQLSRANDELRRMNEGLLKKSRIDPLMEIGNRLAFEEQFSEFHQVCVDRGLPYGVVMCDVDNFKRFNDNFGHQYGDEVLRRLAKSIRSTLRTEDAAFRYGGEEILLLLYRQGLEGARNAAERVRRKVALLALPNMDAELRVTISCGVAAYPESYQADEGWTELIHAADQALYEAKSGGRNRVVVAQNLGSKSKTA